MDGQRRPLGGGLPRRLARHRCGGQATRVTLPVSKDNVVFGVQALSKKGYASLASFPLPRR